MDGLKPCPFCGSEATIKVTPKYTYKIGCKNVFCFGWVYNNSGEYVPMEEAIQVWNTRHEPKTPGGAYVPAGNARLK